MRKTEWIYNSTVPTRPPTTNKTPLKIYCSEWYTNKYMYNRFIKFQIPSTNVSWACHLPTSTKGHKLASLTMFPCHQHFSLTVESDCDVIFAWIDNYFWSLNDAIQQQTIWCISWSNNCRSKYENISYFIFCL